MFRIIPHVTLSPPHDGATLARLVVAPLIHPLSTSPPAAASIAVGMQAVETDRYSDCVFLYSSRVHCVKIKNLFVTTTFLVVLLVIMDTPVKK
jgi:hypothetical protein